MTKRIITVIFAAVATLGLVAAPAQAKPVKLGSAQLGTGQLGSGDLAKPLGWDWGR